MGVGWWWGEDTLSMVQTAWDSWAQALCLCDAQAHFHSCLCCALPTHRHQQLPLLALLLVPSPAEKALASEVGLYAPWRKKKGIIWVILQQCSWKRESQLNASMGCSRGGGLSRGRSSSLLVPWAISGFCNGRCKWDQHVSMSGWRGNLFLLRQTLTVTKPRSAHTAVGDTSYMLNAGDRNIRNTFCCIHEFQ